MGTPARNWLPQFPLLYDGYIGHEKFRQVTTMKLKSIPVLVIALAVTAAPLAVKAQPNQPNQPASQQPQNSLEFAGVELTEQQKQQLGKIRRNTRAQIEKILTPQQREQFKVVVQSRQGREAAFTAMKLSPEQQTQLRGILQAAQSQAQAVLTPKQRQQIQQYIQERRQSAPRGK